MAKENGLVCWLSRSGSLQPFFPETVICPATVLLERVGRPLGEVSLLAQPRASANHLKSHPLANLSSTETESHGCWTISLLLHILANFSTRVECVSQPLGICTVLSLLVPNGHPVGQVWIARALEAGVILELWTLVAQGQGVCAEPRGAGTTTVSSDLGLPARTLSEQCCGIPNNRSRLRVKMTYLLH